MRRKNGWKQPIKFVENAIGRRVRDMFEDSVRLKVDGREHRTEMLRDAYEQHADAYVLVSGDSDLSRAVRIVRYSVKKPIRVFNPQRGICNELRKYSTLYRNLEIGCTAGCRLPDSFATDDGRTIHCPESWRA